MDMQKRSRAAHDSEPGRPTAKATPRFVACGAPIARVARSAGVARIAGIAAIASIACLATAACGTEEPADPPPTAVGQPQVEGIDVRDVDCRSPACCVGRGGRCGGTMDCCAGTACVAMADGYFRCAVPCTFDGDCRSGCCALASPDGQLVCTGAPCCSGGATPCNT